MGLKTPCSFLFFRSSDLLRPSFEGLSKEEDEIGLSEPINVASNLKWHPFLILVAVCSFSQPLCTCITNLSSISAALALLANTQTSIRTTQASLKRETSAKQEFNAISRRPPLIATLQSRAQLFLDDTLPNGFQIYSYNCLLPL